MNTIIQQKFQRVFKSTFGHFFYFAAIGSFLIAFSPLGLTQTATPEQRNYINSMSPDDLYSAYVEQMVTLMQSQGVSLSQRQWSYLTTCTKNKLEATFTADEMRVVFIKPPNMNQNYYGAKVRKVINEVKTSCLPVTRALR